MIGSRPVLCNGGHKRQNCGTKIGFPGCNPASNPPEKFKSYR
jgi:hypothetical protein